MSGFLLDTALVYDLTVISRDEDGFRPTGVRILNPFSNARPAGK